jgi:DNA-directed RNA polymerase specialized sigma24 family protein
MARPLNNITEAGAAYTRSAYVEANIDEALAQNMDTVLRRAAIRNPKHPDYMPLECLLHLAREARLNRDKAAESKLLAPLLTRSELILKKSIPDGSRHDAEEIRQDILGAFCEMFASVGTNQEASSLDYFEVRFHSALASLKFQRLRKESRRQKAFADLGQEKDKDGEPLDEENTLAKLSAAAQSPARQENLLYLQQVGKFLATLSPADREAVILVSIKGYKIESEDSDEATAATLCGVSGRAIRKRLKKVAEQLKKFQQE